MTYHRIMLKLSGEMFGGVRGIGAGIARVFLRQGATVVVCARREPESPVEADGAVAESSVSRTLTSRGAIVAVDDLREPTEVAFENIRQVAAELEGEPR